MDWMNLQLVSMIYLLNFLLLLPFAFSKLISGSNLFTPTKRKKTTPQMKHGNFLSTVVS